MDGLVSTGNKFPITILKIILSNKKNFRLIFIHIFVRWFVDIGNVLKSDEPETGKLEFCFYPF
jgi:hypothetical protein